MLRYPFSRRLAIAGGIVLPALETARRWKEWPGPLDTWLPWVDDYILGAALLIAALVGRPRWLTAAWGFCCGAGFGSTLGQLDAMLHPGSNPWLEPSGLGHGWAAAVKGALVLVGLVGLVASTRTDAPLDTGT
jgi:hypothetical protein